jgi:hypothetical protein
MFQPTPFVMLSTDHNFSATAVNSSFHSEIRNSLLDLERYCIIEFQCEVQSLYCGLVGVAATESHLPLENCPPGGSKTAKSDSIWVNPGWQPGWQPGYL